MIKYRLRGFDRLIKGLEESRNSINREGVLAMRKSLAIIETNVVSRTPVGVSGQLRQGWSSQVRGTPLEATFYGKVMNPIVYGLPVEEGRRPGKMPPIAPIELWVIRKLGIVGADSRGVAYLVARKIGRSGTKGAFMAKKGAEASISEIKAIWARFPGTIVEEITK